MRDIQELLKEKERAIEQVRRQVEALRSVCPLLSHAGPNTPQPAVCWELGAEKDNQLGEALRAVAPLLVEETDEFDPSLRARLVAAGERSQPGQDKEDFVSTQTDGGATAGCKFSGHTVIEALRGFLFLLQSQSSKER